MLKFLKTIPYLLLTPLYVILAVFIYWSILSLYPPISITVIDYKPKTMAAGDILEVQSKVTTTRDCTYQITRELINDSSSTIIGYFETTAPESYQPYVDSKILIPSNIIDGTYVLRIKIVPICNFYDSVIHNPILLPPLNITIDNTPVIVTDFRVLTPIVKLKQPIEIEADLTKRRFCETTVDTFFLTKNNGVIVDRTSKPSAAIDLGQQTIKEIIQNNLPVGKYIIKRSLHLYCPNKTYQVNDKPIDLEVVAN